MKVWIFMIKNNTAVLGNIDCEEEKIEKKTSHLSVLFCFFLRQASNFQGSLVCIVEQLTILCLHQQLQCHGSRLQELCIIFAPFLSGKLAQLAIT